MYSEGNGGEIRIMGAQFVLSSFAFRFHTYTYAQAHRRNAMQLSSCPSIAAPRIFAYLSSAAGVVVAASTTTNADVQKPDVAKRSRLRSL